MNFEPSPASPNLEKLMESRSLPESDRDEIRAFVMLLNVFAADNRGEKPDVSPELKAWALGKDSAHEPPKGQ